MNSKATKQTIIVTGAAGFIGAALVKALLTLDFKVIGIDNLNDYYSTSLKRSRLTQIEKVSKKKGEWIFYEIPIEDDPLRRKPSIYLAQKELNWEPKVMFKEGLAITREYFENQLTFEKLNK